MQCADQLSCLPRTFNASVMFVCTRLCLYASLSLCPNIRQVFGCSFGRVGQRVQGRAAAAHPALTQRAALPSGVGSERVGHPCAGGNSRR